MYNTESILHSKTSAHILEEIFFNKKNSDYAVLTVAWALQS